MSPNAKTLKLLGKDDKNSPGFLDPQSAGQLIRQLEKFTGCALSLRDFLRGSHSALHRYKTYSKWSDSGDFDLRKEFSLQRELSAVENLGNAMWGLSKKKLAQESGIAFAIDDPLIDGLQSHFYQPDFKVLRVSGWLISEPDSELYFESDYGRLCFRANHERAAVGELGRTHGFSHARPDIGFKELIPWKWRGFYLKVSPQYRDPVVLATFSRSPDS